MERAARIASLDGIRGLSIALVALGHLTGTTNFFGGRRLPEMSALAYFGVRIFFVLSGFLITTLLLEELATRGTISLRRFYLRRSLRILPAALVYIAVILALGATGALSLAPGDTLHSLTFTVNYHHARSWYVSHLWSLSVEEQFYLLWPAVLLLAGRRAGLALAGLVVVAAPFVRVCTWIWLPAHRIGIGEAFFTVADSLATGCLLAGARAALGRRPRYLTFLGSPAFLVVPILGAAAAATSRYFFIDFALGQTIQNAAIALCIDRSIRHPEGAAGRLLNHPRLVRLGALSYSLYLWQQPFLNRFTRSHLALFPINLGLALLAAWLSHRYVEQPFLRLRSRFEGEASRRS